MKKLAALVPAVALAASGLVAGTAGSAQAYDCTYNGCFGTQTDIEGPNSVVIRTRPTYDITVVALGSSDSPEGEVVVSFINPRGRLKANRTVSAAYDGGILSVRPLKRLNKQGAWTITANFASENGPYYPSQDSTITFVAVPD